MGWLLRHETGAHPLFGAGRARLLAISLLLPILLLDVAWGAKDRELTERAVALVREARLEEALPLFEDLVKRHPKDAAAAFNLGLCRTRLKRYREALPALELATRLDPGHVKAWFFLGVCRSALGDRVAAAEAFSQADRLHPGNPTVRYNLARELAGAGRRRLAAPILRDLLKAAPKDPSLLSLLGSVELGQGAPAKAAEHLKQAVHLEPDAFLALFYLGKSYAALHEYRCAEPLFRRCLTLNPGAPLVEREIGILAARKGDFGDAIDRLRFALGESPEDAEGLGWLGYALYHLGEAEAALPVLLVSLALSQDDDEVRQDLARTYLRLFETTGKTRYRTLAVSELDRLLQGDPENAFAHYERAKLAAESGRAADAISELEQNLERQPNHTPSAYLLARLYAKSGKRDEAKRIFSRFQELAAKDSATDKDRRKLLLSEEDVDLRIDLAARHLAAGELAEGEQMAKEAISVAPENPAAHALHARLLIAEGKLLEAEKEARLAKRLAPNRPIAIKALAQVELVKGRPLEAKRLLQPIATSAGDAELWLNLATAEGLLGEDEESAASCLQALRIRPDLPEALLGLAVAYRKQGSNAEAVATLHRLLERHPGNETARNLLRRFEQEASR